MPVLIPDLLYHDGRFRAGLAVQYDTGTGRIRRVVPTGELGAGPHANDDGAADAEPDRSDAAPGESAGRESGARPRVRRLAGRALLPGFVNAHSHAFQRLIRGRTQWRHASEAQADFWSWRESMYAAALALSPEDVFAVSRFCFLEMLRAGYTAVGEFHYLHRGPEGRRYADPNELGKRVIAAAESVGIRIALLRVCYATGGIGQPLGPEQRRFATPDLDDYFHDTELLLDAFTAPMPTDAANGGPDDGWAGPTAGGPVDTHPLVTVGVAPHSVRAVPRDWLGRLHDWAAEHDVACHIHASEQPGEVDACRSSYGLRPIELLDEERALSDRLAVVHATHSTDEEAALLGDAGATVCACPTTERDLGDGFLPAGELLDAGAAIALGSDSHTVIDPFEEMRLVEYHERLRRRRRVVLAVPDGPDRVEVAPLLMELGTAAGAAALRLDAGRLAPGMLADMVAVDLEHRALAGWTPETLAPLLTLSCSPDVVSDVWVGGERRVEASRHPLAGEATQAFRRVAARS